MTAMLASVTSPEEAETAISGGADIIDLKDPTSGSLGALPLARIAETVVRVAGRRQTSAVIGDLPADLPVVTKGVIETAETGVDYVKVGLFPGNDRSAVIAGLQEIAARTRLIAVLFADLEPDPIQFVPSLAEAGFAGVMLDTADKRSAGLLRHVEVTGLSSFIHVARRRGLLVGLAGGLEEPDVPRLLALEPDFLGFRGALCAAHDRRSGIDLGAVRTIRALIPRAAADEEPANVDYRLLSARGYHPEAAGRDSASQSIFVRDFVLPVRIGAYSHERNAPQKVRFDVSVEVERARGEPQGMGQVFSYDLITDGIKALVAEGHVELVETLAERIAAIVLRHPRAKRVTVKVEKLEVGTGGVGVEIVRHRPEEAAGQNPVLAMLEDRGRKPRA